MSSGTFPYGSPQAFRRGLTDRLNQVARTDGRFTLDELLRQFAYDRALARLFSSPDSGQWVLKGAGALLARIRVSRHSRDIDLFYDVTEADTDEAVDALRAALDLDLGDFFDFRITGVSPLLEEAKGRRVHVTASLGPTPFAPFHIDVVVGTSMTAEPDETPPLVPITIEGLVRPQYRVFPIADHLADKFCATFATYRRAGDSEQRSTRVKDLVDIGIIATSQVVDAVALRTAVVTNAALRSVAVPAAFAVPDSGAWASRYPAVAADAPGEVPDYEEATRLAGLLFQAVSDATLSGSWEPVARRWVAGT